MGGLTAAAAAAVAVLALAAAVVRARRYVTQHDAKRFPRIALAKIYEQIKPGDVILFVPYVHGFTNSLLHNTVFSHSAVVTDRIAEGDFMTKGISGQFLLAESTYACESAPGVPMPNGSTFTPFLTRLAHYAGTAFWMRLKSPLSLKNRQALHVASAEQCAYPSVPQALWACLGGNTSSRHCFQQTAHILTAAGIQGLTDESFFSVCRAVVDLPDSGQYDPPIAIEISLEPQLGPAEKIATGCRRVRFANKVVAIPAADLNAC